MKARTASQGVVAAILEDGETTWINFTIRTAVRSPREKTSVDSPGYPVDLDVSENGLLIGVAYLTVADNQVSSYVAFYNFGNTGQNQMDNMVSGYTYDDVWRPAFTTWTHPGRLCCGTTDLCCIRAGKFGRDENRAGRGGDCQHLF